MNFADIFDLPMKVYGNSFARISEMAGNKMTKGNTQLTDLSDPNRPIKLAERFGELYDACWTNVFEEFMIHHTKGTEVEEKKATDGLKCLLQVHLNTHHRSTLNRQSEIKNSTALSWASEAVVVVVGVGRKIRQGSPSSNALVRSG